MKKPATLIANPYEPDDSEQGACVYYKMPSSGTIQFDLFPSRYLTARTPILFYLMKGHHTEIEGTEVIAYTKNILPDTILLTKIIANRGLCLVEWEENQCDGCRAEIPLRKNEFAKSSDIHQKPNDPTDPFGIGCTAHLYDRPKLTDGKITLYL